MEILVMAFVVIVSGFIGDRAGAAILEVRRLKRLRDERAVTEQGENTDA